MYTCRECGWFIKIKLTRDRQKEEIREHFRTKHPMIPNVRVAEEITRVRGNDNDFIVIEK
jgi:hypothetical protein